ncbi:hypothetical protein AQ490_24275 [Wenjunlia vitaminophila]|uniref:Transcobalamin-like C-terminal domain-containing protein n=1 Tax=Wenjunlia vitaminophila TaxID=76728 RepID=A0A0T6LRE2_WENVI|nr:DUF4430 domain-containing protein [Wenjunlia vitaminophila]KRV48653.1 hypothetical protein AQ490_24275 [Wenjunlia vitaminophila]
MSLASVLRRTAVATAVLGLTLTTASTATAAPKRPVVNAPVTVNLTVQGPASTLFSGSLSTTGHDVTTASGGTHHCDGTNGGANTTPGATPTAALDDAAHTQGFTWDGTWYASFDDYFVTSIASVPGGADAYWNISVNGTPIPVGGCQFRLNSGDKVAFTWTEL